MATKKKDTPDWPIGKFEDLRYDAKNKNIIKALARDVARFPADIAGKGSQFGLRENLINAADYARKFIKWDKTLNERGNELASSLHRNWNGK
jgi:hypothetical protein